MKETVDFEDLSEEIFPYIDGIFMVSGSDKTFYEMPHKAKTLSNFLHSGSEEDFIEIVEYEDG